MVDRRRECGLPWLWWIFFGKQSSGQALRMAMNLQPFQTMKKMKFWIPAIAVPFALVACGDNTTQEDVSATGDSAVESAVEAVEEAAAEAEEAANEAINEVEEAAENAAADVETAVTEAIEAARERVEEPASDN